MKCSLKNEKEKMKKYFLFFVLTFVTEVSNMDQSFTNPRNIDRGLEYEQAKIVLGGGATILQLITSRFFPYSEENNDRYAVKTFKTFIPDVGNSIFRYYLRTELEPYSTLMGLLYVMEDEIRTGKKIINNISKTGEICSEENKKLLKKALFELSISTNVVLVNIFYKLCWSYYTVPRPSGYPG
jgi:hypothetical protein